MQTQTFLKKIAAKTKSSKKRNYGWLMGLLIVAVVPALFWTLLAAFGMYLSGYEVGKNTTVLIGLALAIAGFLSAVCGPILKRGKDY